MPVRAGSRASFGTSVLLFFVGASAHATDTEPERHQAFQLQATRVIEKAANQLNKSALRTGRRSQSTHGRAFLQAGMAADPRSVTRDDIFHALKKGGFMRSSGPLHCTGHFGEHRHTIALDPSQISLVNCETNKGCEACKNCVRFKLMSGVNDRDCIQSEAEFKAACNQLGLRWENPEECNKYNVRLRSNCRALGIPIYIYDNGPESTTASTIDNGGCNPAAVKLLLSCREMDLERRECTPAKVQLRKDCEYLKVHVDECSQIKVDQEKERRQSNMEFSSS